LFVKELGFSDEHGSVLDRTGSGLKPILADQDWIRLQFCLEVGGSGLDRTEKSFVVLMRLFRKYQKFSCDPISQVC